MAKTTRTPYNASRWITKFVSSSTTLEFKHTGQCIFVTANESIDLNVSFLDNGSYFKIILREDASNDVKIIFPSVEGVVVYDDGNGVGVVNVGVGGLKTLVLPSGCSAGTYIDLICDGDKWYATGMGHGAIIIQE